ncbi:MAG: DNA polymerase III subunit beta [Oscillospiraceae bacterium]|nr:DNA polymerase III subunit beta [Oscillospiraceae bacterium]
MKFKCEKAQLQNAVNIAIRAVAPKSPIQALEGLLLQAGDDLRITGYNLKEGIYTTVGAEVEERGAIVVGARLFSEMIRRLPDGIVFFEADKNCGVNVRCGKSDYRFIGIDAQDYPEMPAVEEEKSISLPQETLRSMINQTIFAIAQSDVRPVYTGTLFEVEEDSLTLVSVDGYRLARRTEKLEQTGWTQGSFIVPGTALSDVERICGDGEESVKISVGNKHIAFILGDSVVVTRRLEGEFLNYRKSIPESFRHVIAVDRAEFMSVIDRVSLIVSEKNSAPVRLTFGDGSIRCLCMTPLGKAEDFCSCIGEGGGMEIGFNDRYLMDALKAAGKEKLNLCINTASSPTIIEANDGTKGFTYMILPVRLRAD